MKLMGSLILFFALVWQWAAKLSFLKTRFVGFPWSKIKANRGLSPFLLPFFTTLETVGKTHAMILQGACLFHFGNVNFRAMMPFGLAMRIRMHQNAVP